MSAPHTRLNWLKRKAPQITVAVILAAVAAFLLLELLGGAVVDDTWLIINPWIGTIISVLRNVTQTLSSMGYTGVFTLTLLDAISFPLPSEAILPFAGYLVCIGKLNMWLTIAVATAASVVGALFSYWIGLKGVQVLGKYRLLGKVILSPDQLATAAHWFDKYGSIMVFLGRLIPIFRTVISFPAGAVKMSIPKFVALTTVGCLIWNSILIYVGFYLGNKWREVAGVSRYLVIAVIVVAFLLFAAYLVRRRKRLRD